MSVRFSPYGAPVTAPAPVRHAPASTPSPYATQPEAPVVGAPKAFKPLVPQIAKAVGRLKNKHGVAKMAQAMDVTENTVRSMVAGEGMRVSTFEALCEVAGWTVTVTDETGKAIISS